jgi:hypothetical protein
MDGDTFQFVGSKVSHCIAKQSTHLQDPISMEDCLMVTLRFLATGESFSRFQFSTRIPQCTISKIIPETCKATYETMKDEFLKVSQLLFVLLCICNTVAIISVQFQGRLFTIKNSYW